MTEGIGVDAVDPDQSCSPHKVDETHGRWPAPSGWTAVAPAGSLRQNRSVRVERNRENVFTVTATGQELSALIAGARLALDAMRASPETPAAAMELLGRVLDDFDRSRQQLSESPRNGDRR